MQFTDIRLLRLINEHLVGEKFEKPEDVIKWFGAVQSQDYAGVKWAIAQRIKGDVMSSDIDEVFNAGKILRTHVMRPTWHFVDPTDLRWLMTLTAPRVRQILSYYDSQVDVNLNETILKKCYVIIIQALKGGNALTRTELSDALKKGGVDATGRRMGHLIGHAEIDMVICSGPLKGKQHTFTLFDERVPKTKSLSRDEALAEITKRYFTSHGPATVQDCSWWSGLTVADIQKGVLFNKSYLTSEVIHGKPYWFAKDQKQKTENKRTVFLLPNYDEYLISYKDYHPIQDSAFGKKYASNVMLMGHMLVVDGLVVGGWKRTFEKKSVVVTIKGLREITHEEKTLLQKETEKFSKFLEMPVVLRD
jgi:hypothetical protein